MIGHIINNNQDLNIFRNLQQNPGTNRRAGSEEEAIRQTGLTEDTFERSGGPRNGAGIQGAETGRGQHSQDAQDTRAIEESAANEIPEEELGAVKEEKTEELPENDNPNDAELSESEKKEVEELKDADRKVRQHEMAHLAAAAGIATSGASFTYKQGPDGVNYAVGGEVNIDTSEESTPEATIAKAQKIQAAASAPADPSPQDRSVAASARQMEAKARIEMANDAQEDAQPGEIPKTPGTSESTQSPDSPNTQSTTNKNIEGHINSRTNPGIETYQKIQAFAPAVTQTYQPRINMVA